MTHAPLDWLPPDKHAAICFSVDDIHPSTSADAYEAGGDLGQGALGRLAQLLRRHPSLRATLFVTPDWRPDGLTRSRHLLSRIPWLAARVHWASMQPRERFRVDRFPSFVAYLNSLAQTEVALHGLHHVHVGRHLAVEFQDQDYARCRDAVEEGLAIFERAGLHHVRGFAPPAWRLPENLRAALDDLEFDFVASARDLHTPIDTAALSAMSGLQGADLIRPQSIGANGLIHISTNFQATSSAERAYEIIDAGGLLAVKAHIFKSGGGHSMLDGLDELYINYLDLLFSDLARRYGDALWWTSMGEIARRLRSGA